MVKQKIETIVRSWQRENDELNRLTITVIKRHRADLKDKQFAETKQDFMERKMMEWPEALFYAIWLKLTEEERHFFNSKIGSKWAARTFPEYCLPEKV